MKKNDFIKLLDIIIEKKIKSIVPAMIKEELKNIKPMINEYRKSDDLDVNALLRDNMNELDNVEKSDVINKTYLKDPVINKLLNETAKEMDNQKSRGSDYYDNDAMNEYKNILASEYVDNSINTQTIQTNSIGEKEIKNEMLKQEIIQQTGNKVIANAMIKDYSTLLKAVDKKSKSKRIV